MRTATCVPRACGDEPAAFHALPTFIFAFPAHAGMNRRRGREPTPDDRVPRAYGDEPLGAILNLFSRKRSPRMRG